MINGKGYTLGDALDSWNHISDELFNQQHYLKVLENNIVPLWLWESLYEELKTRAMKQGLKKGLSLK